jgi:hypothetical protein
LIVGKVQGRLANVPAVSSQLRLGLSVGLHE